MRTKTKDEKSLCKKNGFRKLSNQSSLEHSFLIEGSAEWSIKSPNLNPQSSCDLHKLWGWDWIGKNWFLFKVKNWHPIMVAQISSFEKPSTRWQALNISSCSVSIMETAKTIWKIMNIQTYKQIVHMKHIWQRIIFNSFNIKTCILSYMMRCQGKHMFSSEVCLRLDKISGCCRRQYISGRGHTAGKQRATTVTVEK